MKSAELEVCFFVLFANSVAATAIAAAAGALELVNRAKRSMNASSGGQVLVAALQIQLQLHYWLQLLELAGALREEMRRITLR